MSKTRKTNSSCLIILYHVSSDSSNQGGSKYGVHQGYGCIERMYPFDRFSCFLTFLGNLFVSTYF